MKGMLAPKYREVFLGKAECREVYKITNVGMVIGGHVTSGKIVRGAQVRLVRDGIIVADDKIASLRRFKDDVKEVQDGYDCGMHAGALQQHASWATSSKPTKWKSTETKSRFSRVPIAGRGFALERHSL